MFVRLAGGEEIEDKDIGVLGAHPVDAANPLQNPGGVPGQVIVDDDIRAVQVDAFGQHVGRDQNANILFAGLMAGIVILFDHLAGNRLADVLPVLTTARAVIGEYLPGKMPLKLLGQIGSGFAGFSKDDGLLAFE